MLGLHRNGLLPGESFIISWSSLTLGEWPLPGSARPRISKHQIQKLENVVITPAHGLRAAWFQGNSLDCESESQVLDLVGQLPATEPPGCWPQRRILEPAPHFLNFCTFWNLNFSKVPGLFLCTMKTLYLLTLYTFYCFWGGGGLCPVSTVLGGSSTPLENLP